MNVDSGLHSTAFVSYAHSDPEWSSEQAEARKQHVHLFVSALRQFGIDADADIFHPNVDWTRWGPQRMSSSNFVLIVVSRAWKTAWSGEGDLNLNKGVRAEASALRSIEAQDGAALQRRCRLIFLPGSHEADIPLGLHGIERHHLKAYAQSDLVELIRGLTDQPKYPKMPLGTVPVLPPAMTGHLIEVPDEPASSSTTSGVIVPDEPANSSTTSGVIVPDTQEPSKKPTKDKSPEYVRTLGRFGLTVASVSVERWARIEQLDEQLAALPAPRPEDGPHLPWFRSRNRIESQLHLEVQSANAHKPLASPDNWTTARFAWSTSLDSYSDCDVEVTESEMVAGRVTFGFGSEFPGARGTYHRLDDEMGYAIMQNDPLPTFLHEAHEAHIKKWVTPISDLSEEVTGATDSFNALDQLVKLKIADTPGARMGSPIVTTTERKPNGDFVVVGRAVYLTPRVKKPLLKGGGTARSRWRRSPPRP